MSRLAAVPLGLALVAGACSHPAARPASPVVQTPTVASSDPVELCKALYARQYECRADLIPALVDLRVRHDRPPGIAAAAAAPGGRKEIIDLALKQLETEGIEPKRSATCLAHGPDMPAPMITAAKVCLGQPDCAGLIGCLIPFQESRLSSLPAP